MPGVLGDRARRVSGKGGEVRLIGLDRFGVLAVDGPGFSGFRPRRAVPWEPIAARVHDGENVLPHRNNREGFDLARFHVECLRHGVGDHALDGRFEDFQIVERDFERASGIVGSAHDRVAGKSNLGLDFDGRTAKVDGEGADEGELLGSVHGESRFGDGVAAPWFVLSHYKHLCLYSCIWL